MEERGCDDEVEGSGLSFCPSFSSYSCDGLSVLARAVALDVEGERRLEEERFEPAEPPLKESKEEGEEDADDDDDFEFVPVIGDDAGHGFEINSDRIGPAFPVFNRDLLFNNGYGTDGRDLKSGDGDGGSESRSIMIPPKNLFMEQEHRQSSSSEADELDGIPEGSYCVWTPRGSVHSTPSWCKKSNSTGSRSSKRWRFPDLVRRSNSDRNNSFAFLTPSSSKGESKFAKEKINISGDGNRNSGKSVAAAEARPAASALEVFYTRNKVAVKEGGNKRKSYLPYRQDLVGLFANVNSFGRTFPPFG